MSHRALNSRHSIESCTLQLHSWKPFKTIDNNSKSTSNSNNNNNDNHSLSSSNGPGFNPKRPCLSDRATSFGIDSIDMSKISLFDDDKPFDPKRTSLRLIARKRRRRGSRSVSGRSSDRSGTRRCCSVGASAAYGTCSDFPIAVATDSSGELFGNGGVGDWGSDASEVKNSRKEKEERENLGLGFGQIGCFDAPGMEAGYGSEPGYRGDAEFGYGDEVDEEEEDSRLLFWGDQLEDTNSRMEMVGENTFLDQKVHHRGRRKKHDYKMIYN